MIKGNDTTKNDYFGERVAMSGNFAIVASCLASSKEGKIYIFKRNTNGTWSQSEDIESNYTGSDWDFFGRSIAIDGSYAIVGSQQEETNSITRAGAAYIFKSNASGNYWSRVKLLASDPSANAYFGMSVAIDGNYVIVGAHYNDVDENGDNFVSNAGAAYIFENTNGTWSEIKKIVASDRSTNDNFSTNYAVAISGNNIIVGVQRDDSYAGSAYIFEG